MKMEDILVEKGENICNTRDSLIDVDNKFLMDKIKLYCKYCLSLEKDKVNSAWSGLYKEIEEYFKELESWLNKSNIDARHTRLKGK